MIPSSNRKQNNWPWLLAKRVDKIQQVNTLQMRNRLNHTFSRFSHLIRHRKSWQVLLQKIFLKKEYII